MAGSGWGNAYLIPAAAAFFWGSNVCGCSIFGMVAINRREYSCWGGYWAPNIDLSRIQHVGANERESLALGPKLGTVGATFLE